MYSDQRRHFLQHALALGIVVLLLGEGLPGQRTWVVKQNGGGDFRTIQAAFNAAKNGDSVIVHAASYQESAVTSKSLFVLGRGRPRVDRLTIMGLPATGRIVVKGFDLSNLGSNAPLSLSNNGGRVHIEDVTARANPITFFPASGLAITNCALVSVTGGSFFGSPGVSIGTSTVYLVNTRLSGANALFRAFNVNPAQPGLRTLGGTAVFSGGSCVGGAGLLQGFITAPPGAGIEIFSGDVLVTGNRKTVVSAGAAAPTTMGAASAIRVFRGTLVVDPRVILNPTNAKAITGGNPVFATVPALMASGQAPGKSVRTELFAPPGWTSGLLLGLPGYRLSLPPLGNVWLDLGQVFFLLDVGVVGASGSRIVDVPFFAALPRGLPATFQALTLSKTTNLFLMSTAVTVVLD